MWFWIEPKFRSVAKYVKIVFGHNFVNKNLAIANRSRVSSAHNTVHPSTASVPITVLLSVVTRFKCVLKGLNYVTCTKTVIAAITAKYKDDCNLSE